MDTCHVLLGQPWQFDRNVIHDGSRNTHYLETQKENCVKPMHERISSKVTRKGGDVNLLTGPNS